MRTGAAIAYAAALAALPLEQRQCRRRCALTSVKEALHSPSMNRPLRSVRLGPREVQVERRSGGVIHLRSPHALGPYPRHLLERLAYWAERAPERTLFAQRNAE